MSQFLQSQFIQFLTIAYRASKNDRPGEFQKYFGLQSIAFSVRLKLHLF